MHFRGPADIGKTTMALRIAQTLGRPITFITGDIWMTGADLVGREVGHVTTRVDDKHISSVRRSETRSRIDWQEAPLTKAMLGGHTLVYDEFSRSTPHANAAFLSVLEERVLPVADPAAGRAYVRAHPDFRIILTSNPDDYRGVNEVPDALLDRVITFPLDDFSLKTETGIVVTATEIGRDEAAAIVRLVTILREEGEGGLGLSLRASLLIARLVQGTGVRVAAEPMFLQICADVLAARLSRGAISELINTILRRRAQWLGGLGASGSTEDLQ